MTNTTLAKKIIGLGHNNDCLFCGFKDKAATDALTPQEPNDFLRQFLDCPECGKPESFVISEANPCDGYCIAEGHIYAVRLIPQEEKDGD